MSLAFTVNGLGTFTASVTDGSEVYTVVMTGGTASFTAAIASVGPKGNDGAAGAQGPAGVVAATAPITYNSGTQTVGIDTSYFLRSPAVAGTDGQHLIWDEATARPVWAANETGTVYTTGTNKTGATLTKGTVVYINGAQGSKFTIAKAIASGDPTSAQTLGVVQSDIANNAQGVVITFGEISGLNTSAYSDGTQLYLSPTTAGTFTSTKPSAPDHLVYVAVVSYAHQNQGKILVKIQNGYELEELHNVAIASVANNDILAYDSATSLWKNKTRTALDLLTATTAASTYQTQAGMSAYLTNSSAASTYLTQSNAASTYQTISGMSSYLTTSTAASTYLTQSSAASTYQTQAGMSSYLTTASAASTYAPLASPTFTGTVTIPSGASISGYLTTSAAASTYQTQAGMSSYALLASPTFTGDPKAPTPATSDNDTSIATTAFVNAYCPAASTTVAGKVELATDAETIAGTSTSLANTPSGSKAASYPLNTVQQEATSHTWLTASSGGAFAANQRLAKFINAFTATGYGTVYTDTVNTAIGSQATSGIDWSKEQSIAARISINPLPSSNNTVLRFMWGKSSASGVAGDLGVRGIGIKMTGNNALVLMAHNGSSLSTATTSFTPSANSCFELMLRSYGTGTVEAFVNGSSIGTVTGGPTSQGAANLNAIHVEDENLNTVTTGSQLYVTSVRYLTNK